ncbi:uncharacterized protein N7511_009044 [Penicillium nucicola]|uniref:uncharacterized protein n=1 Tax=Penicillium nucicola TaxID=1850975 RepID=UPI00254592CC|nr:uncharacterized protein N7511_009044 [Penicillium nucicola]KAJ5747348.1 hypothetical protein N7511_009044 [Penicillium nucicola]
MESLSQLNCPPSPPSPANIKYQGHQGDSGYERQALHLPVDQTDVTKLPVIPGPGCYSASEGLV